MSFDSELARGIFLMPRCDSCKKTVWPPSEFCSGCFGPTTLKKWDHDGRVKEFSRKDGQYFCVVELEKTVRIMAKISTMPEIDQSVKITGCGIKDGSYFFHVS